MSLTPTDPTSSCTSTTSRATTSTCGSRRAACCARGRCPRGCRPTRSRTGSPSRSATTSSTTSRYEDDDKSIADIGWWEDEDRTERRMLFVLHGREASVRYALIDTGRDWLLHRTKDQPVD